MSRLPGPAYHFRTPDQMKCLHRTSLVDAVILDVEKGAELDLRDDRPLQALAARGKDEVIWIDSHGCLIAAGCKGPQVVSGGRRPRIVVGRERIWVLSNRRLVQLDRETLHLLIDRPLPQGSDIALAGKDGIWLLDGTELLRMNERGSQPSHVLTLPDAPLAIASAEGTLASLAVDGLHIDFPLQKPPFSISLEGLCGGGSWIGKTTRLASAGSALLVTGQIRTDQGTIEPRFLLIGADGGLRVSGSWRGNQAPRMLAASGANLIGVFEGADGKTRLRQFTGVAQASGELILTRALDTAGPAGAWLRADVEAELPEGATLSLRWAATNDQSLRMTIDQIMSDSSRAIADRIAEAERVIGGRWRPTSGHITYLGQRRDQLVRERFALPLHEANGSTLWLTILLRQNGAATPPRLQGLVVLHEAESLMDNLPAVYRSLAARDSDDGSATLASGDGDRTMRRIVGVLEASTQELDERIGLLAQRLDPARTEDRRLPELAAMLGLPFHDALSPKMQRDLLKATPFILQRGTRAGLLAMLRALFPGRPVRVTDRTSELAPLVLGSGNGLPALLSGPSRRVPMLNGRLVLNRTGLCPTDPCSATIIEPAPLVLVSIPATGREQGRYAQAMRSMIGQMIPAGVRLQLQWTAWRARDDDAPLPEEALGVVDAPLPLRIGEGQPLGRARLGGRRDPRIDRGGVRPLPHSLL